MHTIGRIAARCAALLLVATGIVACSSTPKDDTAQWTSERLYAEAKEEAATGNYERAGKLYERLEGRAAGSVLAQQAQIERAYIMFVLQAEGGNKTRAAEVLGIDPSTLYRKLSRYEGTEVK